MSNCNLYIKAKDNYKQHTWTKIWLWKYRALEKEGTKSKEEKKITLYSNFCFYLNLSTIIWMLTYMLYIVYNRCNVCQPKEKKSLYNLARIMIEISYILLLHGFKGGKVYRWVNQGFMHIKHIFFFFYQ